MRKLLLLVLGLALLAPASAPAATPPCGSVVTHDVTFDHDLSCGPDVVANLIIGADGVTVDLNGHTMGSPDRALISSSGFDRVRVLNGTLQTQFIGVDMSGGHHNLVRNVAGFGDVAGVRFRDGSNNEVIDGALDCRAICGFGADVLEGEQNDTIQGSGPLFGGIVLHSTQHSRVSGNQITDPQMVAIELDADSHHNQVEDNDVVDTDDRDPVTVAGDHNDLVRNEVRGVRTPFGGGGWFLVTGTHNRLIGNQVSGSQIDGIKVTEPGNRLGDNVAVDNTLLGINAVFGSKDLGGNRASGNGDARQCVGVSCSP
jgi:hypothetical protein